MCLAVALTLSSDSKSGRRNLELGSAGTLTAAGAPQPISWRDP